MVNNLEYNYSYKVIAIDKLSEFDLINLDKYYLPIIGHKAKDLYLSLFKLIKNNESDTALCYVLITKLELSNDEFKLLRYKLEGVGLLSTYRNNDLLVFDLHLPLNKRLFFSSNNLNLLTLLRQTIGENEYNTLKAEAILTSVDYQKYQNISKGMDEVYQIDPIFIDHNKWLMDINNNKLKHKHFEYGEVLNEIEAKELFEANVLRDNSTFELLNNCAFCFNLNTQDIIDCLQRIAKIDKSFSEKAFMNACKKKYTELLNGEENNTQVKVHNSYTTDASIKALEKTHTDALVFTKYGTHLTASEVTIVETLMRKDGYSLGMVNCLTIYIMEHNNGAFPAINYFRKIGNEWIRRGVKSTKDCYAMLQEESNKPIYANKKKEKAVPSWVKEYKENLKDDKPQDNTQFTDEELQQIKDLFK